MSLLLLSSLLLLLLIVKQMSVSLSHALNTFNTALNEDQCWSLALQTLRQIQTIPLNRGARVNEKHLIINQDGTVSLIINEDNEEKIATRNELLVELGVLLFRALDFGLHDDEERSLSRDLESLIESLTSFSDETKDEGIDDENQIDDVINKCLMRLTNESAEEILKNLVKEVKELNEFLIKVKRKDSEELNDWARLWVHVIRQLRDGRQRLKPLTNEERIPLEFELTPFELLLEDIREKRYKLNPISGHMTCKSNKDAHQLILEFIRSRPTLVPVSQRQLKDPPLIQTTVYEKLMASIRQKDKIKLKPIQTQPSVSHNVRAEHSQQQQHSLTPQPQRRLIKADLNLRLSNEDDDDDNDTQNESRKFSLKNLSLKLLERRHSIDVCESPTIDNNEDTRQHVADIWQSCEWGRALQCLSLTLQEVQHIRSVLTKAELETLAVTRELREDLESGKICFTCLKTRFSFFGSRPHSCKVCERTICERCVTRMHIPCETFEKVPIYMLSPTPSPPLETKEFNVVRQMEPQQQQTKLKQLLSRDSILVDSGLRKSGPLVRVCRDCKRLIRHLIDTGSVNHY